MDKKIEYLILLVLFLIGIGGVISFRTLQVRKIERIPFSAKKSSFILKPPADVLIGKLVLVKGEVKKESREKEEFEPVETEAEILQGEKLVTGRKSQAIVEFSEFLTIEIDSNSQVDFVNLIPANFLLSQSSSTVNYQLLQEDNPVSVRCLHSLLSFDGGEGEVFIEGGEMTVEIISGQAKLALVDLENETHVWQLEKEQKVLIDDRKRRVEIKKL